MCWSESPSARPTAQQLLRYLEDASHTWIPLGYPVPGGRNGEQDLTYLWRRVEYGDRRSDKWSACPLDEYVVYLIVCTSLLPLILMSWWYMFRLYS